MSVRDPRLRVALAWLPAISYTLLIWWLSSQSFELSLIERVPWQDKGVHFLEYAALCFFLVHAVATTWPGRPVGGPVVAVCMTVALGLLDELHQAFVPGRSADPADLVADALGAAFAAVLYVVLARAWRALWKPKPDRAEV